MNHRTARRDRVIALLLGLGAVLVAPSCGLFATRIGTILKDLPSYQGKSVTVAGTVKERIDLPAVKLFVVDDGTGAIGVVTRRALPRVGDKVRAKGSVKTAFKLGNRSLVVLIEPFQPPKPPRRTAPPERAPS